jgi:hypothetical protein
VPKAVLLCGGDLGVRGRRVTKRMVRRCKFAGTAWPRETFFEVMKTPGTDAVISRVPQSVFGGG